MKKFTVCLTIVFGFVCASFAHAATTWSAQDYDLYPGDFNGDGITDILYVAKDPSKPSGIAYSSALNGQTTALSFSQTWESNYLGIQWYGNAYGVIVGDFNGDGASDILLQRNTPGDSYLLFSNPTNTFSGNLFTGISQNISYNAFGLPSSFDRYKLLVGDFDGDGRADLFLQATSSSDVSAVVVADANGQFTSAPAQLLHDGDLGFNWSTPRSVISVGSFGGPLSPRGKDTADLLIQSKPKIVMIDYDIPIPVPVYAPGSFGVAFSAGGSALFQLANIRQWNRIDANHIDWSPQLYNVVVGDFQAFDAAGISDVILQAKNPSRASYLVVGNIAGAVFGTETALATNVGWSADSVKLLAGNFDTARGDGVYFQAVAPSGSNSYANDVTVAPVTTIAHDGSQYTVIFPTTVAGRMAGSAGVSTTGAATYSIPIDLPDGIKGLTPHLAISYNSVGTSGLLGPRWDLTGVSSIHRCAATLAQDGLLDTVTVVITDRLCLDGNKLHLVSGVQGQDGSQYRPELDNFSLVIAHGSYGNGPQSFEVKRKDGLTYEYATSPGSAVVHPKVTPQTIISWSLSKIRDRWGNYIAFNYVTFPSSPGLALIDTIQYTWNSNSAVAPPYTIKFNYTSTSPSGQPLPLLLSAMVAGGALNLSSILTSIQISYSGSIVRSYNIGYAANGYGAPRRPLLQSVQECGVSTSECLAPTMFNWTFGTAGWNGVQGGTQSLTFSSSLRLMDMNGDGRDDAVFYDSNTGQWMIMWGTPLGFSAAAFTGATSSSSWYGISAGPSDIDGDGRMDLLIDNNGTWCLLRYTANGSFSYTQISVPLPSFVAPVFADVNGDGYQDLVMATDNIYVSLHASDGSASFSGSLQNAWIDNLGAYVNNLQAGTGSSVNRTVDFDGDGRQDIYFTTGNKYRFLYANGLGDGASFADSLSTQYGGLDAPLSPMNSNSDACTDYIATVLIHGYPNSYPMTSFCLRGHLQGQGAHTPDGHTVAIDWDGDGIQEFMFYGIDATNTTGWHPGLGNPALSNVAMSSSATQIYAADIDGDGLHDLVWVDPSTNTLMYQLHAGVTPQLVTTVTDGYRNTTTFDYEPNEQRALYNE